MDVESEAIGDERWEARREQHLLVWGESMQCKLCMKITVDSLLVYCLAVTIQIAS